MGKHRQPSAPYMIWVEDDPATIDVEIYELQAIGPTPVDSQLISDSEEALEKIRRDPAFFEAADLIIFDVLMPDYGNKFFTKNLPKPVGVQLCEALIGKVSSYSPERLDRLKRKLVYYTRTLPDTPQYEAAEASADEHKFHFIAGSPTSRAILELERKDILKFTDKGIQIISSDRLKHDMRHKNA